MKFANYAKHYLADYSAVAIVGAYYALQTQIEALPDLPSWAVVALVILGTVRGVVIQLFADRDGDGKPDFTLTPDELAKGLIAGVKDANEAKALIDAHADKPVQGSEAEPDAPVAESSKDTKPPRGGENDVSGESPGDA